MQPSMGPIRHCASSCPETNSTLTKSWFVSEFEMHFLHAPPSSCTSPPCHQLKYSNLCLPPRTQQREPPSSYVLHVNQSINTATHLCHASLCQSATAMVTCDARAVDFWSDGSAKKIQAANEGRFPKWVGKGKVRKRRKRWKFSDQINLKWQTVTYRRHGCCR